MSLSKFLAVHSAGSQLIETNIFLANKHKEYTTEIQES